MSEAQEWETGSESENFMSGSGCRARPQQAQHSAWETPQAAVYLGLSGGHVLLS